MMGLVRFILMSSAMLDDYISCNPLALHLKLSKNRSPTFFDEV